jgi:hypothetical protein
VRKIWTTAVGDAKRAQRALAKAGHFVVIKTVTICHVAYYALVSLEAHGSYRYAAGVLAIIVVVEVFKGAEHE